VFGVILWSAAISSVVGAAYTSASFFKTFHPVFARHERVCIPVFIILSTTIFVLVGKPTQLLVFAGAINGFILPIALAVMLIAATSRRLMGTYRHPRWMLAADWVVVLIMGGLSVPVLVEQVGNLVR
jgi:Mn2+/Fe2+ NRAMP family transporter